MKTHKTDFQALDQHIHHEAARQGIRPFASYVDEANAAALGIGTVIGLLRRDALDRSDEEGTPVLSDYDVDNLLGLVQFAAFAIQVNTDQLRTWAEKHFVRKGEQ